MELAKSGPVAWIPDFTRFWKNVDAFAAVAE
jgi:hypothetical protein